LLIVALILAIVGVAGYYIIQNRKVLSMQDATRIAAIVGAGEGEEWQCLNKRSNWKDAHLRSCPCC